MYTRGTHRNAQEWIAQFDAAHPEAARAAAEALVAERGARGDLCPCGAAVLLSGWCTSGHDNTAHERD